MTRVGLLVGLFCSAAALAAPQSIQSVYDLHYGGARIGEVTESFKIDGETYSIDSTARATGPLALVLPGPLVLSTRGQVTAQGLRPLAFSSRQGNKAEKTYFADFAWEAGVLTLRKHDKQEKHDLKPGTVDTLSLIYQFLFNPPVLNSESKFTLTTGKRVKPYAYRVLGEERIKTPLGLINAIHVSKLVTDARDSFYDVWVDKDRHFVPVRVVAKDDDGRVVEQVLRTISIQ